MRIIDSHFHVWRQADLPWLMGPMQPRIFGGYEAIRRDYPISEYLADIAATGVEKAVYVQANWPNEKAVEEVAWIERLALETGWPHASIAYADMMVEDIRPFLDRLMRHPRVRGIRQQFHWHRNPQYRFAMHAELCRDTLVQRNIVRLADYALTFDLQVFAGQMVGAAELAQACPRVIFVLQHAGMLEDLSSRGREEWQKGMAALAACPNVMVKLSGLGTFLHRVDAAHIAWVYAETLVHFGHARCLWGSNFPIEKLWTGYAPLLAAHRNAMRGLDEAAMRALLFDNASRVYRL
jgi:predicted TIM-barrel fold metal-dependent hydrolase